jgi:hypothetical protein
MGRPRHQQHHLSWPVFEIASNDSGARNEVLFAISRQANKTAILEKVAHVHLPLPKFWDEDFEKERFSPSLRAKRSSSSMTSHSLSSFDSIVHMEEGRASSILPPKRGNSWTRAIRHRKFTTYFQLFALVAIPNLAMFVIVNDRLRRGLETFKNGDQAPGKGLTEMLTSVSANLTVAIILRNEHIINLLFQIFVVHVPLWVPLRIRRLFAKVYCFGGIHSGAGVMAAVWYTEFSLCTAWGNIHKVGPSTALERALVALTGLICFLLFAIVTTALPGLRSRIHDCFEMTHRFCGWLLLIAFWVQTLIFCIGFAVNRRVQFWQALLRLPTVWMLGLMTVLIIYPYARAKRVNVRVDKLSDHAARFHFNDKKIMPPCRVVRISDNIYRETHAFATIPEPGGRPGYSILVSNAGDWTDRIIRNPPEHLQIKGYPTWGVLRIATLFQPVVIAATGSGIGPCLGLFNGCPDLTCRILWSTKSPETTYGESIVNTVRRADPNARIIDTTIQGRPDMTQLAYSLYREIQAEAVIVISNKKVTYDVVQRLECRGVPAFGPIWDS